MVSCQQIVQRYQQIPYNTLLIILASTINVKVLIACSLTDAAAAITVIKLIMTSSKLYYNISPTKSGERYYNGFSSLLRYLCIKNCFASSTLSSQRYFSIFPRISGTSTASLKVEVVALVTSFSVFVKRFI